MTPGQQVITTDQLTQEAAQMALELRFAHKAVMELQAEVARLREQLKEREDTGEDGGQ